MIDSFCCEDMRYHATNHCPVHDSPYECPDWLIVRDDEGDFGIVIHDGGTSCVEIRYCPWCGTRLTAENRT